MTKGFWDADGNYVESVKCGWNHCCGSCKVRYCCDDNYLLLTQEQQERCPESNAKMKSKNIGTLTGAIIGAVLLLLLIVLVIICCVVPCCLCYKWRKRRQRNTVNTTTVIHVPASVPPAQYQPSYPGYQSVPLQPGSTMSFPTAPPSYLEATDPSCSSPPVDHGQMPPYPVHPQPTDERIQLPYNPAYCPNP
ncbi:protein shisa-5-like [Sphaeramia orbicularis]|uniref:protein shisa-5-like n=1 Tax=Sphaeramia orbicularis TaxID=375764 RepID=UPI00117F2CFC|nr:protein shisa-5-like [Sphaeramia orbicularis]